MACGRGGEGRRAQGSVVLGLYGQFEASQDYMSSSLKKKKKKKRKRGREERRQREGSRIEKTESRHMAREGGGWNPGTGFARWKVTISLGLYSWPSLALRTESHPQLPIQGQTLVGSVSHCHFYPLVVTADGQKLH